MEPARTALDRVPDAREIADVLASDGEFVCSIGPLPHQRIVDFHWAAHQAGQLLGIKVRVIAKGRGRGRGAMVTLRVVPRGQTRPVAVP